ncbi:von Willebrand factor type A domain-containing protein [Candidatus Poribacteria bacterium]|nr:von Willebrand factor type A domain-containing protein [Candidatus Poribacteria bacterium]
MLQAIGTSALKVEIPPIPDNSECRVQIRYAERVEKTDESLVYTHHLRTNQPVGSFLMSIDIEGEDALGDIESPSHDVTIVQNYASANVAYYAADVELDSDFVCRYAVMSNAINEEMPVLCDVVMDDTPPLKSPRLMFNQVSKRKRPAQLREAPTFSALVPLSAPLNPPNGAAYHDVFFKGHGTNPFIDPEDDNLSTFGMDADSAAYSVMRRYLQDGNLPPTEAVRVEEFINAFDYDYTPPTDTAFALHLEGAPSKFGEGKRRQLLRIGIQGRVVPDTDRKDAILTFVIDVSGSMGMESRLELVKKALRLLVKQLRPADKIGIVVYGTDARVVLPHTSVVNREHILERIDSLCPEGVTNLEDGLHTGYELARKNTETDCINRVILCSDGVANAGQTASDVLLKQIRNYVDNDDIFLTTVGFGMGNYNDPLMEELAKKGNGNYAYVDTLNEARRIFVENLTGTLQTIAKDAKVQVKFNPDTVRQFRLIGYESRQMKHEDFRNDDADAGEIGSGHSVTALYEVKLERGVNSGKLAKVSIRYEDPDTQEVTEVSEKFLVENFKAKFEDASQGLQFAATVAQFAEILRESFWVKNGCLKTVRQTLKSILKQHPEVVAKDEARAEKRSEELLALVRTAERLKQQEQSS